MGFKPSILELSSQPCKTEAATAQKRRGETKQITWVELMETKARMLFMAELGKTWSGLK